MTPLGEARLPNGSRLLFCYGVKDFSPLPSLPTLEKIALIAVEIFHLHKAGYGKANFSQVSESSCSIHCPVCGMTEGNMRGDVRTIGDLVRVFKSTLELPRGQAPI